MALPGVNAMVGRRAPFSAIRGSLPADALTCCCMRNSIQTTLHLLPIFSLLSSLLDPHGLPLSSLSQFVLYVDR